MKRRRADPTLGILAIGLTIGFVARLTPVGGRRLPGWATPHEAIFEAEQLLAQGSCLPSRLFRDPRTAHLLPIVSPTLVELLATEAHRHPFETRSDEDLSAMLETVSGIGPIKAGRLLPFLCSQERASHSIPDL